MGQGANGPCLTRKLMESGPWAGVTRLLPPWAQGGLDGERRSDIPLQPERGVGVGGVGADWPPLSSAWYRHPERLLCLN